MFRGLASFVLVSIGVLAGAAAAVPAEGQFLTVAPGPNDAPVAMRPSEANRFRHPLWGEIDRDCLGKPWFSDFALDYAADLTITTSGDVHIVRKRPDETNAFIDCAEDVIEAHDFGPRRFNVTAPFAFTESTKSYRTDIGDNLTNPIALAAAIYHGDIVSTCAAGAVICPTAPIALPLLCGMCTYSVIADPEVLVPKREPLPESDPNLAERWARRRQLGDQPEKKQQAAPTKWAQKTSVSVVDIDIGIDADDAHRSAIERRINDWPERIGYRFDKRYPRGGGKSVTLDIEWTIEPTGYVYIASANGVSAKVFHALIGRELRGRQFDTWRSESVSCRGRIVVRAGVAAR